MPRRAASAPRDPIDPATVEVVPLTPDRWADFSALFDEGGDPKACSCMFWRVRSRDWSFANAAEARAGMRSLVDDARDPAPGLLAYVGGRAVGWVSIAPREDYGRLVNSRVRPPIDDVPVWSIVCFVVSRTVRGQGLMTRLLDAAMDYARAHGAPGSRSLSRAAGGGPDNAAVGYTGLLSTFLAAGFHVVREIDSPQSTVQRVIVRRDV
jgi:GNAT superfamily N-acetyltransferase